MSVSPLLLCLACVSMVEYGWSRVESPALSSAHLQLINSSRSLQFNTWHFSLFFAILSVTSSDIVLGWCLLTTTLSTHLCLPVTNIIQSGEMFFANAHRSPSLIPSLSEPNQTRRSSLNYLLTSINNSSNLTTPISIFVPALWVPKH